MYFSRIRIKPEIFKNTQLARVLSDNNYNVHRLLWDLFTEKKNRDFLYREEIAREQLGTQAGARGEPVYYVVSFTRPFSENPLFQVETKNYEPKLQNGDRLRFELRANPVVTAKKERKNPERFLKERSRRNVENKNKLTKKRVRHDVVMNAQRMFLTSLCAELNLQSHLFSAAKKQDYKKVLIAHGGDHLNERLTAFLKNDFQYAERLKQSMKLHNKLEWCLKASIDHALEKWIINQGERHGFELVIDENNQCKLQNSAYRWHSIKSDRGKKSGFSSVDFLGELEITDVEKLTKALFGGVGRAKAFGCGLMIVRRI
jgi:CRISPR system Cascade subunit CasE